MTRRPRTVSGPAGPRRIGVPLVPTMLLADADADACQMMRDALLEGIGPCDLRTVASAGELEAYLGDDEVTAPSLILVDLDLPAAPASALDAVRAVKRNPGLRCIPVVVLARHPERDDIQAAYEAGANTVIRKPVTFLALVKLIKVFTAYWLDAAALPE